MIIRYRTTATATATATATVLASRAAAAWAASDAVSGMIPSKRMSRRSSTPPSAVAAGVPTLVPAWGGARELDPRALAFGAPRREPPRGPDRDQVIVAALEAGLRRAVEGRADRGAGG